MKDRLILSHDHGRFGLDNKDITSHHTPVIYFFSINQHLWCTYDSYVYKLSSPYDRFCLFVFGCIKIDNRIYLDSLIAINSSQCYLRYCYNYKVKEYNWQSPDFVNRTKKRQTGNLF